MAAQCSFEFDNVFGPAVKCGQQPFDFTILFEQSILSIGPSALMLIFSALRLYRLHKRDIKTLPSAFQTAKAVLTIIFVILQLTLLVLWSSHDHERVRTTIPSAVLSFSSALGVAILSWIEHRKSLRPSTLLGVYLLSSIVFSITQARTLYIRDDNYVIAGVLSGSIGTQLLLLLFETKDKRAWLMPPYRGFSPESTAGIFNRTIFWWLDPLFMKGFWKSLGLDDLFSLDRDLTSGVLRERIQTSWEKCRSNSRYKLIYASALCLRWSWLRIIIPRCCLIGFNYAQPFLIHRILSLLSQPTNIETKDYGYGLIAATGLIYFGIAISTVHYQHQMFRMVTMFRGAIVPMIYNKTLILYADVYDESAAVTLMSTDIDRIANSLELANEVWARIVEIGIGIWLLNLQLGWVCVAPIIVVLVCSAAELRIASFISGTQVEWIQAIQRRIAMTSATLRSMRSVKMMGLVENVSAILYAQRIQELHLGKRFRWMIVWLNVIGSIPQISAPLITFSAFAIQAEVRGSTPLSTVQAFTSLSIIYLVTNPATSLLSSLPVVASAFGCFERINKFLNSPQLKDHRNRTDHAILYENLGHDGSDEAMPDTVELQELQPMGSQTNDTCILMENVDVRPSSTSQITLHYISLHAVRGSWTTILGPVGCGKSTLIKAILGELPCESGSIRISSPRMAYCSQNPWLPNTSIREAVCGASVFDLIWYKSVIYGCVLEEDIAQLPHGDSSVIGSQGLTLSGGQKQRIALARAIYARRDIIVLDDILSALDVKTEENLVARLFDKHGLRHRWNPTIVMATHSARHLSMSDHIIVLSPEGHIAQEGAFDVLRTVPGLISTILSQPNFKAQENATSDNRAQPTAMKSIKRPTEEQFADLTRRTGDFAVYAYYLKSIGLWYSIVALFIILVYTFAVNFPQIWLMWYSDDHGQKSAQFIGIYVFLIMVASVSQGAMIWQIMIKIVPKSGARLHKILLKTVMRAPMSFFAKTDSGIILNRFSQDMTLVDAVLPSEAFGTFKAAIQCLAQAALISLGSSYIAIIILPSIVILYFIQMFYLRTSRQLRFLDLEAKSPLYSHFVETLEGLSTIRAFGWQSAFQGTNERYLDKSQQPYYLLYCVQRWLNLVLDLLAATIAVIVVALATTLRSTTNPGTLGVSLTSILALTQSLQDLISSWTTLETSLGAVARTKTFEADTIAEDKPGEDFSPPSNWPDKGLIEVRDVTAKYDGNITALRNISMTIHPGEKIGICGRTGSGKSSLLYVLLRLLDMDKGAIFIDGIDICTVPRNVLRSRLIAIPQDPLIIAGSVRLNVDPLTLTSDDEAITSALQKVRLWESIQARGGLDADVNVQPLSKGEQQLLALARAMLRKQNMGKILFLDEATSNVDNETDELIQRIIHEEFEGYTVVTIAHRLGTIKHCGKLAVLDGGRLVTFETPEKVLEVDMGAIVEANGD